MKQVFLSGRGGIEVLDVPIPQKLPRSILVRNAFSLISSGTEGAAVTRHGGLRGLYEKAVSSRDRIEQVWSLTKSMGIQQTATLVRAKLDDLTAVGYSSAGVVVEASEGSGFAAGDRVACVGVGFASHAEYVTVPRNLAARIPEDVSLEEGAFGALSCIALHGIRRLQLSGGERVAVIGLGLIGQIAVRLLDAMGYQVLGVDLHEARVARAKATGSVAAWALGGEQIVRQVETVTGGRGADAVLVCAATASDEVVNLAFDLCRERGRVSIVGDVGLGLQREKMYRKELDLVMSRSYGPGRYDAEYEIEGRDYPPGYVRWTEQRNLEYVLDLLGSRKIELGSLISAKLPAQNATEAYARIKSGDASTFAVLLEYPERAEETIPKETPRAAAVRTAKSGRVRIGLIGVGSFAKAVHLPNLRAASELFEVAAVASRSGGPAAVAARSFAGAAAVSDYRMILERDDIEAVLISTRHASHAAMTLDALRAGKHVFVEKPLATTVEDAREIARVAAETGLVVRVGFNRRFAPMMGELRRVMGDSGPRMVSMRVNIGRIAGDWSNTDEEGGRLLGEGVHFFDLCNWLLGAEPAGVSATFAGHATPTNPNAFITVRYADDSVATIHYTALGDPRMGKEYFEVFGGGRAARCDDFKKIEVAGRKLSLPTGRNNKGHRAGLDEFAAAVRGRVLPVAGADARAGLLATWIAIQSRIAALERREVALDV